MKTLDAVALMKGLRKISPRDQEWIDEHGTEVEDLIYEESEGRKQSWNDGSMLGSPNACKGAL